MINIGVLGGTFNPIHFGHLRIAEELKEQFPFHKTFLIPAGNPPLKNTELADGYHRLRMVELAIAHNPDFEALDLEIGLEGKSYSALTVKKLAQRFNNIGNLFFIIGIDAFLDFHRWFEPESILSITNIVIISRPNYLFRALSSSRYLLGIPENKLSQLDNGEIDGFEFPLKTGKTVYFYPLLPIGISSSYVRALIRQGRSVKYLLPEPVESYIITHNLYDSKQP
jgi:nicotinate-nucleotide adenylyltransferase